VGRGLADPRPRSKKAQPDRAQGTRGNVSIKSLTMLHPWVGGPEGKSRWRHVIIAIIRTELAIQGAGGHCREYYR